MRKFYLPVARAIVLFVVCIPAQPVFAQPTISSFSPVSGGAGSTVTISGTNFNTTAANNIVYFGATKAIVNTASATSLSVTVPIGTTYQPISVFNSGTALTGFSTVPYGFDVSFPATQSIASSDFSAAQSFTTGTAPSGIYIQDIDGDGKADIATANYTSENISFFRNASSSGSISFIATTMNAGSEPLALAFGDIDNDGKADLVVGNSYLAGGVGVGNTVTVFKNNSTSGSISFAAGVSFTTAFEPYSIAIGDINGDGKADLVVASYNNGNNPGNVSLLRNTSSGGTISFAAKVDLAMPKPVGGVSLGDLNGDGKPDVMASSSGIFGSYGNNVSVFQNNTVTGSSTLSFGAAQNFTTGSSPYPVNVADIDGDGKNDLVTANYADNNISVLRNTSSGGSISFALQQTYATGNGNSFLGIGDLDGDGKPDVAVANYGPTSTGNTVSVLRNNSTPGTIAFNAKVDLTTGTAPYQAAIGDFDGDGRADLAVTNYGSTGNGTTISVMRNLKQSTLPISLVNFSGKLINNQLVQLNWQTAEEKNMNSYEAEWSNDSRSWQRIATLPAKNNTGMNDYSCIHTGLPAVNFYRLKMLDIDGRFTYSAVLRINIAGETPVIIYPNPAKDNITISGLNKPVSISIINAAGETVLQKNINATATLINISHLPQGLYLVQVKGDEKTLIYKLQKE